MSDHTPELDSPRSDAHADERPASFLEHARAAVVDVLRTAAVAALVLTFVAQPMRVEGASMLPNLHDGERIIVNKFLYALDGWPTASASIGRSVERGDVVVLYYPNDPSVRYIKRVVGLPGDVVRIDEDGNVSVNGETIDEKYLSAEYTRRPAPMDATRVREHYFFVMGDNRDNSSDSRAWGLVPEKYIVGEAVFRFWPLSEIGAVGD